MGLRPMAASAAAPLLSPIQEQRPKPNKLHTLSEHLGMPQSKAKEATQASLPRLLRSLQEAGWFGQWTHKGQVASGQGLS